MGDQDIKNAIINTMLQKGIVGNHKAQRLSVAGWGVASHNEWRAIVLIDELAQEGVIEAYGGGHRDNIRLASVGRAVKYLKDNGGDLPWGYD